MSAWRPQGTEIQSNVDAHCLPLPTDDYCSDHPPHSFVFPNAHLARSPIIAYMRKSKVLSQAPQAGLLMLCRALCDPHSMPMGGVCLWSLAQSGPLGGLASLTSSTHSRSWLGAFPAYLSLMGPQRLFIAFACYSAPPDCLFLGAGAAGSWERTGDTALCTWHGRCLLVHVFMTHCCSWELSKRAHLHAVCPSLR